MQALKSHSSEIVLVLILILLFACTRIYYGGEQGVMIVWKGELNLSDTLVNLDEMLNMPPQKLLEQHHSIYNQLEDMGMLNTDQTLQDLRKKGSRSKGASESSAPGKDTKAGAPEGNVTSPPTRKDTPDAPDKTATSPEPGEDAPAGASEDKH